MSNGLDISPERDNVSPIPGKRTRELQKADGAFSDSASPPNSALPSLKTTGLIPSQILTPSTPVVTSPSSSAAHFIPDHLGPTSVSSVSARRPRAGTMPSTFHLSSANDVPSKTVGSGMNVMLGVPTSIAGTSMSLPGSGPTTPLSAEFAFSSPLIPSTLPTTAPSNGGSLAVPMSATGPNETAASRLRSGSLTLPSSGLSTAFGPNVFSSVDWAPHPVDVTVSNVTSSNGLRSPDSSTYGDGDSHVRTLDYLGLDNDSPIGGYGLFDPSSPHPSSPLRGSMGMQRMGSVGPPTTTHAPNSDLANAHTRLRSNTVATFPRSHAASTFSMLGTSAAVGGATSRGPAHGDTDVFVSSGQDGSGGHRSNASTDSGRLLYSTTAQEDEEGADTVESRGTNGLAASSLPLSPGRARAVTIGILDESREVFMRRRAGTTTGLTPHVVSMGMSDGKSDYGAESATVDAMTRSLRGLSIGQQDEPRWNVSRPRTPEGGTSISITPPNQQPTRSLWVGNLDPRTTPAELQTVFAPYGAIESLRLIPEKECGFVNFVSIGDAIRAKEDVLNRLGGQLTKSSNLVRIGFGKDISLATNTTSLAHMRTTAGPILGPSLGAGQGGSGRLPSGGYCGPEELNPQTTPTRALWIGSIPSTTTPNQLLNIFAAFGPIESARVLTHKSCGFINFERLDDAIAARKALNGREILGAEVGGVRIGFAKVPTKITHNVPTYGDHAAPSGASTYNALSHMTGVNGVPLDQQVAEGSMADFRSNLVLNAVSNPHFASTQKSTGSQSIGHSPQLGEDGRSASDEHLETVRPSSVNELQNLVRELSGDAPGTDAHVEALATLRTPPSYQTLIPLHVLTDPRYGKRYSNSDAPRLRDLRKRLDSPQLEIDDVDSIAFDLLDECVALSSDYIGNTLVQKLFERGSLAARMAMLERIGPHLAAIGTHKNGTWAVQKIIQCVQEPEEMAMIEQNLAPFVPPLLLNDFGNYVVQGALRFGSPTSDFVFDAMVDRCWEICSGRFGARSTRQTLESPQASRFNVQRVAAALVLNSIPLATSANGALLITWLLDTSSLPGRYRVLAARFAPHLPHLCTHKLASAAVLKIINQRADPQATKMLLDALLDPETKALEEILADQVHGTACISKIVGPSALDDAWRKKVVERARAVLLSLRVSTIPAYRKLQEDLGMGVPSPSGSVPLVAASVAVSQGLTPPSVTNKSSPGLGGGGGGVRGQQQQQQQQQRPGQWGNGPSHAPPIFHPGSTSFGQHHAPQPYYDYAMAGYGPSLPPSSAPYGAFHGSHPSSTMAPPPPQGHAQFASLPYPNYYTSSAPSFNSYPYGTSSRSPNGRGGGGGGATTLPVTLAAPIPLAPPPHFGSTPFTPPTLSPGVHDINFHPFSPTGSIFGRSDSGSHHEGPLRNDRSRYQHQ